MSYTKNNSKWVKDLNVRDKTMELVKENKVAYFCDLELRHDFLNMTSKAQATKETN